MKDKLPISQWSEDDRPREKLLTKGKGQLSRAELIAILIGSGNHEESAVVTIVFLNLIPVMLSH